MPLLGLEPKSRGIRANGMTTIRQKPVDMLHFVTDSLTSVVK